MLDTRLLYFGLLARRSGLMVEFIPLLLPVQHGVFGFLQRAGGLLFSRLQQLQFWRQLFQLQLPGCELVLVLLQMRLCLLQAVQRLAQVCMQLLRALLLELDGLFQTGHFGAQRVIGGLHGIEAVGTIGVILPVLLNAGVHLLVFRIHGLQPHLELTYRLATAAGLAVQLLPLQRVQLCFQGALFSLEFTVLFRRLRLALQVLELTLQLVTQVREALEILHGAAHAGFGFPAPFLVLGNTRRFLDKHA